VARGRTHWLRFRSCRWGSMDGWSGVRRCADSAGTRLMLAGLAPFDAAAHGVPHLGEPAHRRSIPKLRWSVQHHTNAYANPTAALSSNSFAWRMSPRATSSLLWGVCLMVASRLLPFFAAVVAKPRPERAAREDLRIEARLRRGPLHDARDGAIAEPLGNDAAVPVDAARDRPVPDLRGRG